MSDRITADFWPDLSTDAITTPVSILKQHAASLSSKAKYLITGEVETWTANSMIYHRLNVVVPALDNYKYSLLRIHHSPTLYPVHIDEDPLDEHFFGEFADEESFRQYLRRAFSSEATKRILQSLMAQAVA